MRWLVLACIVPSWMLAVGVSYRSYERERVSVEASAATAAQNLMRATERELSSALALLETVALASAIDSRDYAGLEPQIVQAQKLASAFSIFLIDRELQVLAASARPTGDRSARLSVDRFPAQWRAPQPAIADVFLGSLRPVYLAAAGVPVVRQGQVQARLEMIFSLDRFARLISEQMLPPGWTGGIVDSKLNFVARKPEVKDLVGRPAPASLSKDMVARESGCNIVRTVDGIASTACFAKSARFGWVALVAVPTSLLESALRQALLEYTLGALALLAAAMTLANRMGRSITGPVQALVAPALAIGQGRPAQIEPGGLKEANEVAAALTQAQTLLLQREQARQEAESRLRDSQSRLRLALEAALVGDWEIHLASGQMQHSLRHDQCFGYHEPVPNWSEERLLQHVHPDDRAKVAHQLQRAARGGSYQLECRVVWPDASVHWIALRGTVLTEGGVATRALGVVIDITARKQSEEMRLNGIRLEAENRQIQEASRLKSDFLANMSHELRTPLNAVIGFADILSGAHAPPDPHRREQFLGHIANSGRHLLGLINDVLDLSKVEAGRMEFYPRPVDLPALVQEVMSAMQPEATRKQLGLSVDLDSGLHSVVLDAARLKQVLFNFLSNAVKFSHTGGRVVLRLQAEDDDWFRLEVEDSGIGISEADQTRLFSPFQQVNVGASQQHQGTGLGLSLTRRLVELQGGTVGLRSTLGSGSVFFARLPRRIGGSDAASASRRSLEAGHA